mmetsp:Transcript_5199/g.4776  ORF Transcript_5199/g.4776 Transcript_5199/m.4776 type:complete len:107 (-) Transcript_5199:1066-1386(-)
MGFLEQALLGPHDRGPQLILLRGDLLQQVLVVLVLVLGHPFGPRFFLFDLLEDEVLALLALPFDLIVLLLLLLLIPPDLLLEHAHVLPIDLLIEDPFGIFLSDLGG